MFACFFVFFERSVAFVYTCIYELNSLNLNYTGTIYMFVTVNLLYILPPIRSCVYLFLYICVKGEGRCGELAFDGTKPHKKLRLFHLAFHPHSLVLIGFRHRFKRDLHIKKSVLHNRTEINKYTLNSLTLHH